MSSNNNTTELIELTSSPISPNRRPLRKKSWYTLGALTLVGMVATPTIVLGKQDTTDDVPLLHILNRNNTPTQEQEDRIAPSTSTTLASEVTIVWPTTEDEPEGDVTEPTILGEQNIPPAPTTTEEVAVGLPPIPKD